MLFYFACEAAGASSARHSLRPLMFQMALHDPKLARKCAARWRQCGFLRGGIRERCAEGRDGYPSHLWGSRRAKLALGWREAPVAGASVCDVTTPPTGLRPATPRASSAARLAHKGPIKGEGQRGSKARSFLSLPRL